MGIRSWFKKREKREDAKAVKRVQDEIFDTPEEQRMQWATSRDFRPIARPGCSCANPDRSRNTTADRRARARRPPAQPLTVTGMRCTELFE